MRKTSLTFILLTLLLQAWSQPYKDPSLSIHERVQDLLSRMSPEEKFWQLFMLAEEWNRDKSYFVNGAFGFEGGIAEAGDNTAGQMITSQFAGSAAAMTETINKVQQFFLEQTRLGIPVMPFDEALHGLVHQGATRFPQSIGLAASFDTALMHRVAAAIAEETRSRGIRQVLSPVINIAGDVRWGRVEETYGEDPFLTSAMAVAFIREFEQRGVIATPKHFVSNYGSGGRDSYPVHYSERALRETELIPFEAAFRKGGAGSVMTAYNSLDGSPCTAHHWLLNTLLKKEWGFDGFVISDAGATGGANVLHFTTGSYRESAANSLINGLDVIFQTSRDHYPLFIEAFLKGDIPQAVVDSAVARVLRAKFRLGLFETPYADPAAAQKINGCPEHRTAALEAARKSVVLLKNRGALLPLDPAIKSIAVTGQDAVEARAGGYSGPGNQVVSILEGIRQQAGPETRVEYARGSSRLLQPCVTVAPQYLSTRENGKPVQGLTGRYYHGIDFSGAPAFVRTDPQIDFRWTLFSPDPEKLEYGFYSVVWEGKIRGPVSGTVKTGIDGNDGYRLYINNQLLIDQRTYCGRNLTMAGFDFVEGEEYDLRIEYAEPTGNAWFRLVWDFGLAGDAEAQLQQAVETASRCDAIVMVAGIEEGEFRDRALLSLPGNQEELILRLAATGKPLVVILTGGSAVTMERWLGQADALLDVWYPGEAGGTAVAEILFGKANPAGRLPITFPLHEGQLPLVYNHKPTGRGDDYDNLSGQPLFPFGFGLSYTTFSYKNLQINETKNEKSFLASFELTNTGTREGEEVVQLYIRDQLASVARPVTELKGFSRIRLKAGETKHCSFVIEPTMLEMLNFKMEKVVEPGDFSIMIGASCKDIRLKGTLRLNPD